MNPNVKKLIYIKIYRINIVFLEKKNHFILQKYKKCLQKKLLLIKKYLL